MMPVTENDILQALRGVPAEDWVNVLDYVVSLKSTTKSSNNGGADYPILTAADLAQSDIVGLWAGRADITDSREFARQLREKAQQR